MRRNTFDEIFRLGSRRKPWTDEMIERLMDSFDVTETDDGYRRVCEKTQSKHIEEHGFGLDVHHIEPRRNFYKCEEQSIDEANKMENLITLCREHHVKAENGNIDLEVV